MLKIIPVQTKTEQEEICRLFPFAYDAEKFMYAEYEDEVLIGASQFLLQGTCGELTELALLPGHPDDIGALFIMGRAVLNFMDLCHVPDACCTCVMPENKKLMEMIGFSCGEDGRYTVHLEGFFTEPCKDGHCH